MAPNYYRQFFMIVIIFFLSLFGCAQHPVRMPTPETDVPKSAMSEIVRFDPQELQGWKLARPIRTYGKANLFDYIDGGAELYFAYDFNEVATAEYSDGNASILVDVYDMSAPEGAFGIYSLNRYKGVNRVGIGNEGILTEANLDFWKGRFFCKVYCSDPSEKYVSVVKDLGNKLSARISEPGDSPSIVSALPKDGLVKGTEKFFCRKLGLDNIYYLSNDNILNLDGKTKGAVAEYEIDGNQYLFFMIEYPTAEKAGLAFENYVKYIEENGEKISLEPSDCKLARIEGKITIVKLKDNILLGAWNIMTEENAKAILAQRSW